jgi:hypothetical protein
MPAKQQGKKIYRSANGRQIDLDALVSRNELTPAVSNVKVNARGDELGPGGKIVRKREDILRDYYNQGKKMADEVVSKAKQPDTEVDWEEDTEGNFVEAKPKQTRSRKRDV